MYFYTENALITPCGGIFHFQTNKLNQLSLASINDSHQQFANSIISIKAKNSNGEKAKFTYESVTCKGTAIWIEKN